MSTESLPALSLAPSLLLLSKHTCIQHILECLTFKYSPVKSGAFQMKMSFPYTQSIVRSNSRVYQLNSPLGICSFHLDNVKFCCFTKVAIFKRRNASFFFFFLKKFSWVFPLLFWLVWVFFKSFVCFLI